MSTDHASSAVMRVSMARMRDSTPLVRAAIIPKTVGRRLLQPLQTLIDRAQNAQCQILRAGIAHVVKVSFTTHCRNLRGEALLRRF